ncbi:unnamed protein product [Psylliodes chrysocephalus]|uniref:Uncharacterized protein n=1 Tax=Psylliodes chrysocephalus TaxID=3402493 RepID=A0A9P0GFY2_9CUCU|nr:unnamed protein product [Psylliodes chrysocephala]
MMTNINEVWLNKHKLKESRTNPIRVEMLLPSRLDSLADEDREERKILVEALKQARAQNKKAVIRRSKIIIEGQFYTAQELSEEKISDGNISSVFSSPVKKKTVSEPATPTPTEAKSENKVEIEAHLSNNTQYKINSRTQVNLRKRGQTEEYLKRRNFKSYSREEKRKII